MCGTSPVLLCPWREEELHCQLVRTPREEGEGGMREEEEGQRSKGGKERGREEEEEHCIAVLIRKVS